ncbi:vacuolar protein sorting-associated protein 55 homolog [Coffea eugenioides]|uniref:vacuolar protein sorting-associated protein 55 homolog n=1 Tax=Coffea eugenioides TaxID=49369 RepID=UPI000F60A55E|nr:vacuolar protein sorting-associated protein 55 homolog [Coffea eugenioides]XP_027181576.1 vacuolar protein sorting-associated protein 55 homolog [Coffea eugenioides]
MCFVQQLVANANSNNVCGSTYALNFFGWLGYFISLLRILNWADVTKFLSGASAVGSIAIPIILKHAGVIGWEAMATELSSFFTFVLAIVCFIGTSEDDGYSIL